MIAIRFGFAVHAEDFLAGHWAQPPIAEGEPTQAWDPLSQELHPEQCAACHPDQKADWEGSRHRLAMSPGVLVQVLDRPEKNDSCNNCHAPLFEQRPTHSGDRFRAELRDQGLNCISCHVRDGVVYGPPRREGLPPLPDEIPHGGFVEDSAFQDSEFCGTCHQFKPSGRRIAGVLVENTLEEWRASPQAAEGQTCQTCHMPERKHRWRGIHDPQTTEDALDIVLAKTGRRSATYTVTSTGVGHAFPTYVTPRATLLVQALNVTGEVRAEASHVIQRQVPVNLKSQVDTRLSPGESATVDLSWRRSDRVTRIVARTHIEPDEFYERFFESWRPKNPELVQMHAVALEETRSSAYDLGKRELTVQRK